MIKKIFILLSLHEILALPPLFMTKNPGVKVFKRNTAKLNQDEYATDVKDFQKDCKVLQLTFESSRLQHEIVRDHSVRRNNVRLLNKLHVGVGSGDKHHDNAIDLMSDGKLLLPANFHSKPKYGVGISVWLKLKKGSTTGNIFRTVGRDNVVHYDFSINNNGIKWSHVDDRGRKLFNLVTNKNSVALDRWYNIVGTYNGIKGVASLWLNGQLLNETRHASGELSQDWSVASEFGGHMEALMNDIFMFRCFLPRDKIIALYIQGS